MGLLGNIRNWHSEHSARSARSKEEEKLRREDERAVRQREASFMQQHNLRKDPSAPGRYILPGGDRFIDANPRSAASLGKAGKKLSDMELSPRIGTFTKEEKKARSQKSEGVFGTIADLCQNVHDNIGDMGGFSGLAGMGDIGSNMGSFDFFGGSPAPRNTQRKPRRKSSKKK